ncbi:hypothetical protein JOF53_005263 [Crossiella equi]|uniref:DUF4288 domain-containing protein n=1 Tax=Crossiella equi TaxID=130796 RepID=A0ABS5AJ34_9PSEU|nr:DUF4288 domain-containing protein [Crossiella equi]MBP2476391.1 hypothetical protein [Crossiella equi]
MALYCAVLVHSTDGDDPLHEESFVLLTADSEEQARVKALAHGRAAEHEYRDADGELVRWRLTDLVDVGLAPDQEPGDGAQVYSRHFRDYSAYRRFEPLLDGKPL